MTDSWLRVVCDGERRDVFEDTLDETALFVVFRFRLARDEATEDLPDVTLSLSE